MLIEVRAPQKLRYERVLKRSQSDTPPTLKEFAAREKAEQHKDSMKQQVYKVVRLAKVKVNNIGTFDDLRKKLDTLLDDWKPKIEARPSWDDYFMGVTKEVASRATCNRGRSGCVIVKDKRILTTGYVGSPVGVKHCDEVGHEMHSVVHDDGKISQHCIRTTHAEQNALMQAAKHGISIDGSTVYCKMEPCYVCAKMLINAGVTRIVCQKKYHAAQKSRDVFTSAGVELDVLEEDVEEYVNQ
jgi:dCMP deaminase